MSDRKKLASLEARVDTMEKGAARRTWMTALLSGIGVLLTGVIIQATSPLVEDVVTEKPNPCSVQYDAVTKAVKGGVTEDRYLDALAEPGCSIAPHDVARDIQD